MRHQDVTYVAMCNQDVTYEPLVTPDIISLSVPQSAVGLTHSQFRPRGPCGDIVTDVVNSCCDFRDSELCQLLKIAVYTVVGTVLKRLNWKVNRGEGASSVLMPRTRCRSSLVLYAPLNTIRETPLKRYEELQ